MNKEYPLYPTLGETGEQEAIKRVNHFVDQLKKAAEETMHKFYCNELPYIETDTWTNFRNELMDGFKNYNNRKIQGKYDFKEIRQEIYKEFREDIIKDLNQDNLDKIVELEKQIEILQKRYNNNYN